MTEDRTEEAAESAVLTVVMGGQRYTLPALTIAEGEEWQSTLVAELSNLDMPDASSGGEAMMRAILSQGTRSKLATLAAYDKTEVLGGAEAIRAKMTPQELKEALDIVLDAEFPFDGGARSVGGAFGLPLAALTAQLTRATESLSLSANYPSGPSPLGASPTLTSVGNGRPSNSSSAGPTVSGASRRKVKTG